MIPNVPVTETSDAHRRLATAVNLLINRLSVTTAPSLLGATAAGDVVNLTPTQVTALLNVFTATLQGLVPSSGGGTANFLRADGTWAAPPSGSGSVAWGSITGTLSSQTDLQTALDAKANLTGATFTGSITATNLSGTNTGDQTITLTGDVTGSGTGSFAATLAASGVTAATYGDSTHVPQIVVDAKGRITSASNVAITGGGGSGAWTRISEQVLSVDGVPSAFTSIPGTYRDLILAVRGRASNAVTEQQIQVQFNGDTAGNYDFGISFMINTYGQAESFAQTSAQIGGIVGDSAPTGTASHMEAIISNYAGTTFHKQILALSQDKKANSASNIVSWASCATWRSTAAITQVAILQSLKAGSVVTLYGRS